MRRHYYFVYHCSHAQPLDIRCPCGGVTVRCGGHVSPVKVARVKCNALFPRRPGERLVLVECMDREAKYQARILELSKRRADNKFRLMMIGG